MKFIENVLGFLGSGNTFDVIDDNFWIFYIILFILSLCLLGYFVFMFIFA